MGLAYYHFKIQDLVKTTRWSRIVAETTSPRLGYAVLLPLLEAEASIENCAFAVIADNWKTLSVMSTLSDLVD